MYYHEGNSAPTFCNFNFRTIREHSKALSLFLLSSRLSFTLIHTSFKAFPVFKPQKPKKPLCFFVAV